MKGLKWPVEPLGQACIINPRLPKNHGLTDEFFVSFVPMAAVSELEGKILTPQAKKFADVKKGYTHFETGDVLFAKITPCMENGKAAIARDLLGGHGFGSTEFHVIRPKPHVLPEWVFYYVRRPSFRLEAKRSFTGTAGQQRVPTGFLGSAMLPVPPLEEQRRIVDLLSRAEGIVRLRREAQKKAAELIPALFLDMFGDPATNPKGWPVVRLGDLAEKISDGPFGSNLKTSHYTKEGVRVIRLQNIGIGFLNDEDKAFVSREHFASLPRNRCLPDDVIIATLGDPNLRAMVLPASIPEALNKADCVQFRCRREVVEPEYICWLMNMPATLIMASSLIQGITRTRLSMGRLREIFIPFPSLQIQRRFAELVERFRSIKSNQETATQKAEATFQALLAHCFGIPPA